MNYNNEDIPNKNNSQLYNTYFQLSVTEYNAIQKECLHYIDKRAVSITALKIIQESRGWISDAAIISIAQLLNISESDLEGVATFYNQIFRQPVGRHIIRYCDSVVCYLTGYENIKKKIECDLGIISGETTLDNRFTLLPTCCLGVCNRAPVIMVDQDIYCNIIPEKIIQLIGSYV